MLRSDDVTPRAYKQVDVFTRTPLQGNPVAVVLEAEGLSSAQMLALARWTNLSETTFVLKPTHPAADYKVRIFTTEKELPFAGHPTLGTAHALLEAGLTPKRPGTVMQECGVGLVAVDIQPEGTLAFAAPEVEFRPMAAEETERLMAALRPAVMAASPLPVIAEMGIRWLMVRLPDAQSCLARLLKASRFPDGGQTAQGYQVRQGTQLNRDGRVSVRFIDGEPWIGGHCRTLINGTLGI
ncbi:TPA: PhzF family phenazine biosynthesis protein [Serratia marcescens]|nr:PhzF family phenazine biosynthesis protein [Serratia marcescens]